MHWIQNSNEIHTVTFLAGEALPELLLPSEFVPGADPLFSPLLFNPVVVDPAIPANGQYDGTTYANSGIMGREPGQAGEFDLTFTEQGVFDYVCLVHGVAMSGEVVVVGGERLSGVLVAAVLVAVAQNLGTVIFGGSWQDTLVVGVLLVFLFWRPRGLAATFERVKTA